MIPKKIHFCWFGDKPIPKEIEKYIKSWRKYCPDYEIKKWDESNFNIGSCLFVKKAYEAKKWAFVSDYARLKIIYDEGGIYLDTDVELLKNLDDLLVNENFFPIQQDQNIIATGLGFGAQKGSTIIKKMLDVYNNAEFDINRLEDIACPYLNNIVFKKYNYQNGNEIQYFDNGKIAIYPSKFFDPISPGHSSNLLCDETYSIHHYSASWKNKKHQLKRKMINFIGQERVNRFKKIIKR